MKGYILNFILICLCFGCIQSELLVVTKLPKTMKEVSGIALDHKNNRFWMVNDSGNKPILYALDRTGEIQQKIKIDAKNIDWEDLTSDDEGNIYIGDFGNNSNKRKNLRVLIIKEEDLEKMTVKPAIISFYFPDQKKFPPKKDKRYFDCEAFLYLNEHLYLFTKSRVEEHYGQTNLYQIPAKEGEHEAKLMVTFVTCKQKGCWVTSADINTNKNKVVLLTEKGVYLFSDFQDDNFFEGRLRSFNFSTTTQKESVVFKNDSTLYIADEKTKLNGGYLYEFNLK